MTSRPEANGPLDPATLWRALHQLVARVGIALDGESALDDCLDIVLELLRADRGFVLFQQEDGTTRVINARGARRALAPDQREEVSRTIVRKAMETDAMAMWVAAEQPVDTTSIMLLGISAAMAAPLRGQGFARGALYVDFRLPRMALTSAEVEFFRAAVFVLGGMIGQARVSQATREKLAVAEGHVTQGGTRPSLESMLELPGMRAIRTNAELALVGDSPVLVLGESGTGKTIFTQALAEASRRKPVVRIVLGGSDDLNTIASELFGHERNAFSGAANKRIGLVEYADGGTLLLDEVLNLPPHAQKVLLDFTQFGTYRPLGYDKPEPKHAYVRVIAATNGDMRAAVREGRFREDLYYRLAGITIRLPALRERRADIPAIAESALRRADRSRSWTLSLDLRRYLLSNKHEWPGNLRELEWSVRRARDRAVVRNASTTEICVQDFQEVVDVTESAEAASPGADAAETWRQLQETKARLEQRELEVLADVLDKHDGVVAHAAKELGIARTTLAGRIESLGLQRRSKDSTPGGRAKS